jgi:hypothetical protein
MRYLLLLSLLLILVSPNQNQPVSQEGPSVMVLAFKCSKARQTPEKLDPPTTAPAPAVAPFNKNYERNARANAPAGTRDPNADTVDGRSATLDRIVQESRTPTSKPVDGYAYRVKVQNASAKVVEILFLEYQFIDRSNPAALTRRQFLCGVNIKPDKAKELQSFSLSGPTDVVSVSTLANKSGDLFDEKVVINRVEYADGSIWQRKDWNFAEIKRGLERALGTPWATEMCRGL